MSFNFKYERVQSIVICTWGGVEELIKINIIINGDKVIINHINHSMWQFGSSPERLTYEEANKLISELNSNGYAGFYDWHLPNSSEAMLFWQGIYLDV